MRGGGEDARGDGASLSRGEDAPREKGCGKRRRAPSPPFAPPPRTRAQVVVKVEEIEGVEAAMECAREEVEVTAAQLLARVRGMASGAETRALVDSLRAFARTSDARAAASVSQLLATALVEADHAQTPRGVSLRDQTYEHGPFDHCSGASDDEDDTRRRRGSTAADGLFAECDIAVVKRRLQAPPRGRVGMGDQSLELPRPIRVAPNAHVEARIIPDGQFLAGQFGAFARADNAAPLPPGHCVPFVGRVVAKGRNAFELQLGEWRGAAVVIDPDPRAACTYVNDAYGPDQAARRRRAQSGPGSQQNVEFVLVRDRAHFPHAFWRVVVPILPGAQLLGDYGAAYWADGGPGTRPLVDSEVTSSQTGDIIVANTQNISHGSHPHSRHATRSTSARSCGGCSSRSRAAPPTARSFSVTTCNDDDPDGRFGLRSVRVLCAVGWVVGAPSPALY